jgi:hypothetical protein
MYPHGWATHDFFHLELRHHQAVNTDIILVKSIILLLFACKDKLII